MKAINHMLLLAAILALLPEAVAAETFFQWTDPAGVVHFTNIEAEVPTDQKWVQLGVDAAPVARAEPEPEPPVLPPPPAVVGPYGAPLPPVPNIGPPPFAAFSPDECDDNCDVPYIYPGEPVVYPGGQVVYSGGTVVHRGHARHLRPHPAQPLGTGRMQSARVSRGHR